MPQSVTLPFEGLLTPEGLDWAVPTAGGSTFYGFTLEVLDTRIRANEYTLLRKFVDSGWRLYTQSAFSTGSVPYDLIEPQEFSLSWERYALIPVNMGTFGRRIRLDFFSF